MYPAFAAYSNVDSLSCLNTPYSGFCKMLELAITPSILRGKRQAPPDATLKTPVELTPQVDSIPATGHSEAVCADETDTKLGAARTIANAIAFDTCMKGPPSLFSTVRGSHFPGAALIWIKEASGQKRKSRPCAGMSAPAPITDIGRTFPDVRLVPSDSDIPSLFVASPLI